MSKLNLIQTRLRELGDGAFQKLCDAYLHRRGYDRITPLGSVVGANKVRAGTPDSHVALGSGKYVLAEYTTETKRIFEKLKGDLARGLDPAKTGLPLDRIEEVILCHTSLLTPSQDLELVETCRAHGVGLGLYGMGPISLDLCQRFPILARDFLGVEVDTGQILAPDEFVAEYGKSKLATPLDTSFRFREAEVASVLEGLETRDVVLITGRPGVGKSRLALEACERFSKSRQDCRVHCVLSRRMDLYRDLLDHCGDDGLHLIFVDDANRVSRFEYVLQMLSKQGDSRRFKVLATVRDYAADGARQVARPGPAHTNPQTSVM